jgi:alpha-glucosidase
LGFDRGPGFRCVVNLSGDPVEIEPGWTVLLSTTGDLDSIDRNAAAWLVRDR